MRWFGVGIGVTLVLVGLVVLAYRLGWGVGMRDGRRSGWAKGLAEGQAMKATKAPRARTPASAFSGVRAPLSVGQQVVASAAYRKLVQAITSKEAKGTYTSEDIPVGALEPLLRQGSDLTLADVITVLPTGARLLEYVQEESHNLVTGPGTLPQGGLVFRVITAPVNPVVPSEWDPMSRRAIMDPVLLARFIDTQLIPDARDALESELLVGEGGSDPGVVGGRNHLLGLLNTPGIQTLRPDLVVARQMGLISWAKRLVRVNARATANALLLHDEDDVDEPAGLPIIRTSHLPRGTALVGDFQRVVLFDAKSCSVSIGQVNDDFIRNVWRVLLEMPCVLGMFRPQALVAVELP